MTLKETTVRSYLETLLTGATVAGANVFDSRPEPFKPTDMPCINIFTGPAKRHDNTEGLRRDPRAKVMTIIIMGLEKADDGENIGTLLDALTEDIEDLIDADPTLGGNVNHCEWIERNPDYIIEPGQKPMAIIQIEYQALYLQYK